MFLKVGSGSRSGRKSSGSAKLIETDFTCEVPNVEIIQSMSLGIPALKNSLNCYLSLLFSIKDKTLF
jgi:hypothetical protein